MPDEASDHLVRTLGVSDALAASGSYSQALEDLSGSVPDCLVRVFKDVIQILEGALHEGLASSVVSSEGADEQGRLLSDFVVSVPH